MGTDLTPALYRRSCEIVNPEHGCDLALFEPTAIPIEQEWFDFNDPSSLFLGKHASLVCVSVDYPEGCAFIKLDVTDASNESLYFPGGAYDEVSSIFYAIIRATSASLIVPERYVDSSISPAEDAARLIDDWIIDPSYAGYLREPHERLLLDAISHQTEFRLEA